MGTQQPQKHVTHTLALRCSNNGVQTEWHWSLSGVLHHDGKISPGWWVGGARPPPFTISTIRYRVVVYAPAERADTLPPISLLPLYVLCGAAIPFTGLRER